MIASVSSFERPSLRRTVAAGLAAGLAFGLGTIGTFVLLGSGLDHRGPLFDPQVQSAKLIAVWTEMEPLPLFVTAPHLILGAYLLLGVGHALLYRSVAPAWPAAKLSRIWRLWLVIWAFSFVVFEFLGPFNLLGEPLALVALELVFWGLAAAAEAVLIVVALTPHARSATARVSGAPLPA